MPEELAVEQGLGEPGAVDRDESRVAQHAAQVDRPCDQLLAGAALAAQEHGAAVLADGLDQTIHRLHAGALPDQLAEAAQAPDLATERRVLALERRQVEHALQREQDLLRAGVLDEVVGGAELHGLDGGLDRPVAGEHHRGGGDAALVHGAQQVHAVHHRHLEVGQHDVEGDAREARERGLAMRRVLHLVSRSLEVLRQRAGHVELVLDEQDARWHRDQVWTASPPASS